MPATNKVHRSVDERAKFDKWTSLSGRKFTEEFHGSAWLGEYLRGLDRSDHDFDNMDPALRG